MHLIDDAKSSTSIKALLRIVNAPTIAFGGARRADAPFMVKTALIDVAAALRLFFADNADFEKSLDLAFEAAEQAVCGLHVPVSRFNFERLT